jgi:hypothetical protein
MAEPSDNKQPDNTPDAANENHIKDKPRPFKIFAHESAKTNAVLESTSLERREVDGKVVATTRVYAPALEAHAIALKEAGEKRLAVRRETVEALTAEVDAAQKVIDDLQKKIADERAKQDVTKTTLGHATNDLLVEARNVTKETKASLSDKKQVLKKEIKNAKKERTAVYKKTGKQIRRERWNTFKRTTKEAVAFFPDLTVRFAKATKRGAGEVIHVFHRSAKKMGEGYNEPTPFSIKREQPIDAPAPKQDAPKPQGPKQ